MPELPLPEFSLPEVSELHDDTAVHGHVGWNPKTATDILIVGDEMDLPEIRDILEALPGWVRGQVFVEVFDRNFVRPFWVPQHVGVTWLARNEREGDPLTGRCAAPGQAAAVAARAWLSEMRPADSGVALPEHCMWIGIRHSPYSRDLQDELQASYGSTA
ncbi:SIP domain-containing protein [Lysinibacter cavernae]|uniref:NADPH-dependent ferric siderophore reductase n=1 Tax=Lysinibacter cavernae TaxID=1640652 RepID=A0A7X5TU69_9MICO|nr:SIP domain-containing protein [Lysinibacter cavernae]NIH54068.1 NADPH-dependent ferric siderophore reductase [Lysinibacter cavernae]